MLSHDLCYPDIPPIPEFPGISHRIDHWRRQAITLWLIAQGYSLRVEVQWIVANYFGIDHRSGALMQVLSRLRDNEFLKTETQSLRIFSGGRTRFTIVCLADKGRELAQDLGWQVHESEWERMQRLHEKGNYQGKHTAAVLAFTYHARLRGWKAGVMPKAETGNYRYAPDAVVAKGDREYHVEVELSWKIADPKWRNMALYNGMVALCAKHENHQKALVGDAESAVGANAPIMATNLRTLFKDVQEEPLGELWLERW